MGVKQVLRRTLKGFMWYLKLFRVYGIYPYSIFGPKKGSGCP